MGTPEVHVTLTINSRENLLGCELYINRNKDLFKFLQERKDEIENAIGQKIEWIDAAVASRIKINKVITDLFSQSESVNYFSWLYEKTTLFQRVFSKVLKEF
jgi:hypothetical protein